MWNFGLQLPECQHGQWLWDPGNCSTNHLLPCFPSQHLTQWFLTFVTRMLLNCNSQKPQSGQLVVKASGSCTPKLLTNPRLRTSALRPPANSLTCGPSLTEMKWVTTREALLPIVPVTEFFPHPREAYLSPAQLSCRH